MGLTAFVVVMVICPAVAIIGAIIVAVVLQTRNDQRDWRRHDAIRAWAAAHCWSVTPPGLGAPWVARLPGDGRLGVMVSGTYRGRPACAVSYSYTTTSVSAGPNGMPVTHTHTHHYCAFVIRTFRRYPALAVAPRESGSKLWRGLTGPGFGELGQPAFDAKYRVIGPDLVTVRRLITPALIEGHLAGRLPAWHLYDQDLLTYYPTELDVAIIDFGLARVAAVADLLDPG